MKKLYRRTSAVVSKVKELSKKGGRQAKEFLQKEWAIQILPGNKKTKHQDAVERQLITDRNKLQKENRELKQRCKSLETQSTFLSGQVQKAVNKGFTPSRGASKRKLPSEYTDRHCRGLKKRRKDKCVGSLLWLQNEGSTAVQVKLVNNSTGTEETVDLVNEYLLTPEESSITEEEIHTIDMMLYIKDKYNVSAGAYHEMTQVCKKMPRHYKLKDRISELNKLWNIKGTPNGTTGVQQSFKERLEFVLKSLVSTLNIS